MLLLALDSSTRQASVALCSEDELYGEYSWHIGNNHSVELLEGIQRLFVTSGKSMQDIDGVAVAIGPGSFNGLRVALATAKTLAFALQKPLVGISTLDLIAAQQQQWQGLICSILEAGRSELYTACYLCEGVANSSGEVAYHLQRLSDYLLLSPVEIVSYLKEQASNWMPLADEHELPLFLFCGEMSAMSRVALQALMPEQSLFVNPVAAVRRASVLAMLGLQRLQEGKLDSPLLLEPLYLRRPSITSSTRKQPMLSGGVPHVADSRPIGPSTTEREEGALRH